MKNLKITISLILLLAFLLSAGLLYIKGQKTEETIESYTYTIKPVEGASRSILARGILRPSRKATFFSKSTMRPPRRTSKTRRPASIRPNSLSSSSIRNMI